jgi:hypothetical protein
MIHPLYLWVISGAEVAGAEGLAAVEYMEDRIRPIPCTMGFMVLGVLSIVGAVRSYRYIQTSSDT